MKKDKAAVVFERILNNKQPKGLWNYVNNERQRMQRIEKPIGKTYCTNQSPEFVSDWIKVYM